MHRIKELFKDQIEKFRENHDNHLILEEVKRHYRNCEIHANEKMASIETIVTPTEVERCLKTSRRTALETEMKCRGKNILGFIADEVEDSPELLKQTEGKARLTLVPRKIITAIARVREYGNKKYKTSDSWKLNTAVQYNDAAFRHFIAYLDDPESLDEESGLPHLWHLATNISFLIEGGLKDA